jgi:arylsulfatase A-like enzyme
MTKTDAVRRRSGFPAFLLAAGLMATLAPAATALADPRPNMFFMIGDDHPWSAYGFMAKIERRQAPWDAGNASVDTFETETANRALLQHPNLPIIDAQTPEGCQPLVDCAPDDLACDRSCDLGTPTFDWLASRGAVFPVGYVSHPVCWESFRSTQTGLYTTQFLNNDSLEPKVGNYLTQAGYITFGYGKIWQRGYRDIGFDVGPVIRAEARARAQAASNSSNPEIRKSARDYERVAEAGDRTRVRVRYGLGALAKFFEIYYDPAVFPSPDDRPPWFIWYSPRLPHAPFGAGKDFRYEDGSQFGKGMKRGPKFYGNIRVLDAMMMDIFRTIDDEGALAKTLVFYQNDNGALMPGSKKGTGDNGYRTVVMVSGPGIAPNQVLPQLVHGIDFMPTFMDYACEGISPMLCPTSSSWRGQSMRPLLEPGWVGPSLYPPETNGPFTGRRYVFSPKVPDRLVFVHSYDNYRMSRNLTTGALALYDLSADPDETVAIPRAMLPAVYDRLQDQIVNQLPVELQ